MLPAEAADSLISSEMDAAWTPWVRISRDAASTIESRLDLRSPPLADAGTE